MALKFVDMFCGMGTIRMGFEQAGWECVYSVEWDKHKRRIYEIIFGREPEGQDIRTVRGSELPAADCWCFGAPCQDFSIAGKRAGMEGDRSSLVREVFRLVRETTEENRPRWLLYENVKGMLSSNSGLDFLGIVLEMESLGYDVEWQLLNSKDFGVPQNRERVFTLGHLRNRSTRKVFPINYQFKTHYGRTKNNNIQLIQDRRQSSETRVYQSICPTVTKTWGEGGGNVPYVCEQRTDEGLRFFKDNVCGTLRTIDACGDKRIIQGDKFRKLTPKECWRLQGISDEITNKVIAAKISDTQMYRAAGDATTVNVLYEIAKRLGGRE